MRGPTGFLLLLFRVVTLEDIKLMPFQPLLMEDTTGIVAEKDGEIWAITVLDNWSPNSCSVHIWIPNPLVFRHGYKEEVFDFVFGSGRNKIIGQTPSDNPKALKFIEHIGFDCD